MENQPNPDQSGAVQSGAAQSCAAQSGDVESVAGETSQGHDVESKDTEGQRPSDLVRDELPEVPAPGTGTQVSVEDIEEAMRDVVDPELMVNVVDLGLLYGVHVDEHNNATLDMTLTSPTCPLTDRIEYDTQTVLEGLVNEVTINWVWLPPWSLEMITEDGREQLRAIGFNV